MPRPPNLTPEAPTQGQLRVMWSDAEIDGIGPRNVQAAVIGTSAQSIDRWLNNAEVLRPPAWVESWLDLWRMLPPDDRERFVARRLALAE